MLSPRRSAHLGLAAAAIVLASSMTILIRGSADASADQAPAAVAAAHAVDAANQQVVLASHTPTHSR